MTGPTIRLRLLSNLDFRWIELIRQRLDGITDAEYLWEPADGCLTVRPDGTGKYAIDPVRPPEPPLGTIAWRMTHLTGCLSAHRVATAAFGPAWPMHELRGPVGTAVEAIVRLDRAYAHWHAAVESLADSDLNRCLGPAAGRFADTTVLDFVLHVHAEALQRGADLCLLRDLYWHVHACGSRTPA